MTWNHSIIHEATHTSGYAPHPPPTLHANTSDISVCGTWEMNFNTCCQPTPTYDLKPTARNLPCYFRILCFSTKYENIMVTSWMCTPTYIPKRERSGVILVNIKKLWVWQDSAMFTADAPASMWAARYWFFLMNISGVVSAFRLSDPILEVDTLTWIHPSEVISDPTSFTGFIF